MSWLTRQNKQDPKITFKRLIETEGIIQIPGAHDALAAILASKTKFDAIYLSGGAFSASLGLPDLGLITLTELTSRIREIYRATGMPILVDIDTGFGGILNITRTIKEVVEAGAAAIQIEDQEMPKKCGHLNGKKVVPLEEMIQKIQAIKITDPDVVIVARTDAKNIEGINSAIERANAYVQAGAHIIFPEALESEEEFKYFAKNVTAPLLANMTEFGKTPYFTSKQFEELGYKFVIYPVTSLRVASKAIENMYQEIKITGTQEGLLESMQTRAELYDTIDYFEYEAIDQSIAKTILSD